MIIGWWDIEPKSGSAQKTILLHGKIGYSLLDIYTELVWRNLPKGCKALRKRLTKKRQWHLR
jgi:hypothetical protein